MKPRATSSGASTYHYCRKTKLATKDFLRRMRRLIRRRSSFFVSVERNLAAVVDGTGTDPKVEVILHYLA